MVIDYKLLLLRGASGAKAVLSLVMNLYQSLELEGERTPELDRDQ